MGERSVQYKDIYERVEVRIPVPKGFGSDNKRKNDGQM